jgi:hypothetical protein
MKTSLASTALVISALIAGSYACSSSSSSGGGSTGDDTDAGTSSSSQDSGDGTTQDSGNTQQQSACGTGTFACAGNAGSVTCQVGTQYCMSGLGCMAYDSVGTDPCPDCTNPPGDCGGVQTLSCAGNTQSGVTISCN